MLKKIFNNNKGFTLLEVILSIATLAILSGFILQIFIVAADANTRAQNIDKASSEAVNIIETVKSLNSYEEVEKKILKKLITKDGENDTYYKAYDKTWNLVEINDKDEVLKFETIDPMKFSGDTVFLLKFNINSDTNENDMVLNSEDTKVGKLWNMMVDVIDLRVGDVKKNLISYKNCKYFPN